MGRWNTFNYTRILVKNGAVIARSHTQKPGDNHAEAGALKKHPGSLKEVSAYVTLEPCSFHGRTPSCAHALILRKTGCVYVAMTDPDSRNNGQGIAMLRRNGIEVVENVLTGKVSEFLTPYLRS